MIILVTGSNGQLGSEIRDAAIRYPDYQFIYTDRDELDVTDADQVLKFLKKNKVECLINCAGYTAVENAEDDKANATLLNATAPKNMAEATAKVGALMIHISTDYVFEGKQFRPYTEGDTAIPRTIYGKTKLDGEIEVIFNAKRALIFRTSWLYSAHGQNFVKTVIGKAAKGDELRVVFDQIGTPTYAADLARAILDIIPRVSPKVRSEIYNFSNEGVASWYDFARAIVELKGFDCKVTPILSKDIQTKAIRPHYSVLDKSRIKKDYHIAIPHWRESLKLCLERM
jgi:dTDP-4-dehydrorhamnose reductase